MPVSAPADKRFRRAQVRPAQRAAWRRRWIALLAWPLVLIVMLTTGYAVVAQVVSARSLTISRISVTGNERMSTREVHEVLRDLRGTSMLTADLESARQKLLDSPWVADVEIRRRFPSGLSVAMVEREVAAVGRVGADLYLIDTQGAPIVPVGPVHTGVDLPIIDGLGGMPGSGSPVDEQRAILAGRLLTALRARPDLGNRVSQIDLANPRDAVVVLSGDTTLVRLGTERFIERLQLYVDAAPALHEQVPAIDYVDVRHGEQVVVKPRPAHR